MNVELHKKCRGKEVAESVDLRQLDHAPLSPELGHADLLETGSSSALTMLAHDLRNRLTNLSLLFELVEHHAHRRAVEDVGKCTKRAHDLILDMDEMLSTVLDRIRVYGDPLAFEPECVELNEVIVKALELNKLHSENRRIDMVFYPCSEQLVSGDKQLLCQMIENLISNAIRHSEVNSIVRCDLRRRSSYAIIQVSDEGRKLSPKDISLAFRPFSKLTRNERDRPTTTGLGLWIARLIVERHGGTISCRPSEHLSGNAFTVVLPIRRLQPTNAFPVHPKHTVSDNVHPPRRRKMKRHSTTRMTAICACLAATIAIVAPAYAATFEGPTEPKGVTDTLLGSIDLSKEIPGLENREFRMRYFTIEPGGIVPVHSHKDRPAMFYILQGSVIQHRSDIAERTLNEGEVSIEAAGVEHWWENKGTETVILIVADILHVGMPDGEKM